MDNKPDLQLVPEPKELTTKDLFDHENRHLGQCLFELGRAHHESELRKVDVVDWEVKCRNSNKKCLDLQQKLQKEQSALRAVPPAVVQSPVDILPQGSA